MFSLNAGSLPRTIAVAACKSPKMLSLTPAGSGNGNEYGTHSGMCFAFRIISFSSTESFFVTIV